MLRRSPSILEAGYTLIELMIAILLAIFVIGATMTFVFSSVKSSTENIKMTRMNQELRAVMTFMSDEIRRTGFTTSTASSASDMIGMLNWDGVDCLVYAYENDASSANATVNTKSFQRDGNVIRYDVDASCDDSGQALNDPNVVAITDFQAPIIFPGFGGASLAKVTISLSGQTTHGGTVLSNRTITEAVRVRNELPQ